MKIPQLICDNLTGIGFCIVNRDLIRKFAIAQQFLNTLRSLLPGDSSPCRAVERSFSQANCNAVFVIPCGNSPVSSSCCLTEIYSSGIRPKLIAQKFCIAFSAIIELILVDYAFKAVRLAGTAAENAVEHFLRYKRRVRVGMDRRRLILRNIFFHIFTEKVELNSLGGTVRKKIVLRFCEPLHSFIGD